MLIGLQFASLITLGLLSSMVLAIVLAIAFIIGYVSIGFVIGFIIIFNFLTWLIGPWFSDLMYRWLYKCTFYKYEDVQHLEYIKFMKKVCDEHNIKMPKIGMIDDMNPTAFTYGSGAFNSRVVFTKGLLNFLNEKEVEAVLAHELGHIVHRDFIVMTIAATLLQILYEMYVIFTDARGKSSFGKKGEKKGGGRAALYMIGLVSLLFYIIGTYILLYLSRLREYYADKFSAEKTGNPNLLSSALIKIAYGIATVPDTEKTAHLLNNTRALGIFDIKAANEVGLVYENSKKTKGLIERALLFDIVNPWAKLLELKSTHPLVGKRIKAMCKMSNNPAFDFDKLEREDVDKSRLWNNFFKDVAVMYSTHILFLLFILAVGYQFFTDNVFIIPIIFILFFVLFILLSIMKIRYKYPIVGFKEDTILSLMANIYASPVRGKPVILKGNAIGRGQAGAIFSEDIMFKDKSGLIYLNYESGIPLLGNLFFAWKKLEKLLDKPSTAQGWFVRGATHHIELYRFVAGENIVNSYVRAWSIVGAVVGLIGFLLISGWIAGFFIGIT